MAVKPRTDLSVAITLDVDPDANRPVPGRPDAVSARADQARHEACFRGLDTILTCLADRELPATFFWEARTARTLADTAPGLWGRALAYPRLEHACHGLRHEDFAGEMSGSPLDEDATRRVMEEATEVLTDLTGARPRGFRAPYCRLTPALRSVLCELAYTYDASLTRDVAESPGLRPRPLDRARHVTELPLARDHDENGKPMSAYLWQLFEDNRRCDEYTDLVRRVSHGSPGGLLQLALHPWHLYVGTDGLPREGGPGRLEELLDALQDIPDLAFTTDLDYLDAHVPSGD